MTFPDKRFRISALLDTYGMLLSEKQRYALEQYYNEDLSLSETAENIGITRPDITMDEIREASAIACLDDTVTGFSEGYDTFVGERGVTLSGGQKQRAAIARMLTEKTPIMIFDDSLSAVDAETDASIRAGLDRQLGGSTVFLISHRTSTS